MVLEFFVPCPSVVLFTKMHNNTGDNIRVQITNLVNGVCISKLIRKDGKAILRFLDCDDSEDIDRYKFSIIVYDNNNVILNEVKTASEVRDSDYIIN